MAPEPKQIVRYGDKGVAPNSSTSPLLRRISRKPIITYGKKPTRVLSLSGEQFRSDIFNIPSDDEGQSSGHHQAKVLLQAADEHERSEESDSSQVSHDSNIEQQHATRGAAKANIRRTRSKVVASPRASKVAAKAVGRPNNRPILLQREPARPKAAQKTPSKATDRTKAPETVKRKPSKAKATALAKRLPINELFLVNSPLDRTRSGEPQSSYHGILTQDPIQSISSSSRKRRSSSSSIQDFERPGKSSRTSLSALVGRFRPLRYGHKKLRHQGDDLFAIIHRDPKGCDGFEQSEVAVKPQFAKVKRRQSQKDRLVHGFQGLDLQCGPLPDVEFEPSTTELAMSTRDEAGGIDQEQRDYDDEFLPLPATPKRRVSFSDRMRESRIRAELSSVRARERPTSESEESDFDGDGDGDADNEAHDEDDEDLMNDYSVNDSDLLGNGNEVTKTSSLQVIDSHIQNKPRATQQEQVQRPKRTDTTVTLDFRQPLEPGQLPRQSLGKRNLVEVKEAIVEVPGFPTFETNHPTKGVTRISSRRRISQSEQHVPMRRRSILKNSTPGVVDSTCRLAETASNTRRNSLVDAEEGNYFVEAASLLDVFDPARHQIIPRRPSYHLNENVEVLGTGRAVPETSPEPPSLPRYTHHGRHDLLGESRDAQTTSRPPPAAPRNIRGATLVVDPDHVELKQSIRRTMSLL